MDTRVTHNEVESRYELRAGDEEIGIAEYRLHDTADGTVAEFHHTFITPPRRDQGNAERLVSAALDDVRARGLRVRATCWYVDQFLIEHPDYADLRV
jgi:predicted GNAT family acetyltransferase